MFLSNDSDRCHPIFTAPQLTPPHMLLSFTAQIFEVMSKGLSMDAATSALTVSKALQREISDRKVCLVQAIDDLTSKLSVANITRVDNQRGGYLLASEAPESPTNTVPVVSIPPPPSEMRIPSLSITNNSAATPSTTTTTAASNNTKKTKVINKNGKQKNANGGRKRTMEDMNLPNKAGSSSDNNNNASTTNNNNNFQPATRERSDSLAEAVNAKFAENGNHESANSVSGRPGGTVATPSVRAKRARSVDADGDSAAPASAKRSRTPSA